MRTAILKKVLAAATSGAALAALALPALSAGPAAADSNPYPVPCLNGVNGGGSYQQTTVTTGKHKKTTTTVTGGTLTAFLELQDVSCLGATYSFTVASPDGSALGWHTSTAGATTTPNPDGSVTVQVAGDGTSKVLGISGTTSDYTAQCLNLSEATGAGGVSADQSSTVPVCAGSSSGGNMW